MANDIANAISLRQRNVVQIQRTRYRHSVNGRQNHLGVKATNRPRDWRDDDLV